jgi:hypothetical protein
MTLRSPDVRRPILMVAALGMVTAMLAVCTARAAETDLTPAARLDQAAAAYDRGVDLRSSDPAAARTAFLESAAMLQALLDHGADNPELRFNLGNAYVQAGELGQGIAQYLAAQRLRPFDRAIAANLAAARSDVRRRIAGDAATELGGSAPWWRALRVEFRFALLAVAWLALWVLVGARVLRAAWPAWLFRWGIVASATVAIAAGGSIGLDRWLAVNRPLGVVIADDVVVRKGNGDGFEPQVAEKLTAGVEFRLLERRPGWWRVRLPDGTEGWIREEQATAIGGPTGGPFGA